MDAEQFEQSMKQGIQAAGLLPDFDPDRSQVFESPEGLFVEIVVRDGTKLQAFKSVVNELSSKAGENVDSIVRAEWTLERVGDPEPAYSTGGGLRAAELYPVDLKSGAARQQVWIEVTLLAKIFFRDHGIEGEQIKAIVGEFVEERLQIGGASFWDPVRWPNLEINGDTARQIVSRSLLLRKPAV